MLSRVQPFRYAKIAKQVRQRLGKNLKNQKSLYYIRCMQKVCLILRP
ncbi:hypothetical protein HMPREF9296_0669 [Prevotella disiens FB035-09AN]|uniref:Uncharacterized protein n=1 Tax=Prevotella disiens FB035-09AN TaxID=866771 RepID=E1KUI7_9BACT|nr:hypothetical protein HMPREF9296_0669 [Prevotella disiens FB035-09AN]